MKKQSKEDIRDSIIGLGENSIRKNYYPQLKKKVIEVEELNKTLEKKVEKRTEELNKAVIDQKNTNEKLQQTLDELRLTQDTLIESEKMDCSTCHDPHSNEKNNLVKFNNRCIECHQKVEHVTFKSDQNSDCVNCHMPYQESKIMKIQINPDSIRSVMVRTHKIDIY